MAFGDLYGYKTNSRFVVASAESRERSTPNPDYDGDEGQNNGSVPEEFFAVDLVLHGFANGRRNNCPVTVGAADLNDVPVNTAVRAGDVDALSEGTEPGETTGAVPDGVYSGGVSDQGGTGAIA